MTITSASNARKLATWHAIVLIADTLTVTIMDMSQWIALTKYHLQAHQHDTGTTLLVDMTNQHLRIIATPDIPTVTIETGTDSVDLNLAHITLDIGVTVAVTPTEVIPDHFTGPHTIALCATGAQAHTAIAETHDITDPHHTETSPMMTVDPDRHINPTSTITNPHKDHLPVHNQHAGSLKIEGTNRPQLMIHPQNIIALMIMTVIQRMI